MNAMKKSLTRKIGMILFVPVLGAFIALVFFLDYLNKSSSDDAFINVAGYQRMLSERIKSQSERVINDPKYEHQAELHKSVLQFDHSLTVLEFGGEALGRSLPPLPEELLDDLDEIKKNWLMLKPELLMISDVSGGHEDALQAYKSVSLYLAGLTSASNDLVSAYESKSNSEQVAIARFLLAFVLIDVILLVLGVWTIRCYLAERKSSEIQVQRQSLIIDNIDEAVITTDLEGLIVKWNKGAERLFGYTAPYVLGRNVNLLLINEDYANPAKDYFQPLLSQGKASTEIRLKKKCGEEFYAWLAHSTLMDENENVTGMICYCTDITEKKLADEEIKIRIMQQAAIAELGQHALSKSNLHTIMDVAVGLVAGVLRSEYCNVLEYIPEDDNFLLIASEGWEEGLVGHAVINGGLDSQAGYTLQIDKPVIVKNLREDARFNGPELLHEHDVISGVSIVIYDTSRAYGVLGVHTKSERIFTEQDITFLQTVANILSQAIERDRAEHTLRRSEERFRNLVESTSDWIWEVDAQGLYIYVSPQIYDLLGYTIDEVLGKTQCDLMPSDEAARVGIILKEAKANLQPIVALENINIHKTGQQVIFETSGVPFFDKDNNFCGYRGMGRDITGQKKSEERLQDLAHFDQLTKLPNRTLFFSRLHDALDQINKINSNNSLVAVMFLDLDQFKLINDTLGHDAGDMLLKEVAIRLSSIVRSDDTVARLGGDEFAIILTGVAKSSDISRVARNIVKTLEAPITIDGHELFVTSSIGISCAPEDSTNAKLLVTKADIAMFKAKDLGRNNIQKYAPRMDMKTTERLSLETRLRKALERDEFRSYFQPKVFLGTGKMSGMESLLRWQATPEKLIAPIEFISLLEDTGLIVPVGEWILYVSCLQTKKWHDAGFEKMRVSVNLSTRQFREEDLVKMVRRTLHNTGLDPIYLELEITESLLVENFDQTSVALNKLHDMGVHITIDDFGTGYSSLSYLKQFPISTLKIDRSFIKDTPGDAESVALTTTIIAMAKSLHINVVAEGVETKEQVMFLKDLGCNEMQGFYFSRPLPVEDFTVLLENNSCLEFLPGNKNKIISHNLKKIRA